MTSDVSIDGLSIVCVYNNAEVRVECLDRSIHRYDGPLDVDYRPVDNRRHEFTTAGSALNHGASEARHELVVFVHQDVYLHSIDRLAAAGTALLDGSWQMLGASGVTATGDVVGRLRDRTEIIGRSCRTPVEVDTLDEVLFMLRRSDVAAEPLSEDPDLAWHAYAVEYAARLRTAGSRVGAVDCAITHNSLTVNLDRLDVAHRVVGERYPLLRPIHTTCGTIRPPRTRLRDLPVLRDHRWRLRWARGSVVARRIRRLPDVRVVLSDIRHEVDLLDYSENDPLTVINVDSGGDFGDHESGEVDFTRLGKPVIFGSVSSGPELQARLSELAPDASVLVTGLAESDLTGLCDGTRAWTVGLQSGPMWALSGPVARVLPREWSSPAATPFGSPKVG